MRSGAAYTQQVKRTVVPPPLPPPSTRPSRGLHFEATAEALVASEASGGAHKEALSPERRETLALALEPMRRRISSIPISEPVGLLASLLAPSFDDSDPPRSSTHPFAAGPLSDPLVTSTLSTAPVTVAQTQSVAIALDEPADRFTGGARIALRPAFVAASVLVITALLLFGGSLALRGRPRGVVVPGTDSTVSSVAASVPVASSVVTSTEARPALAMSAGVDVTVMTPASAGARTDTKRVTKSTTGSQTLLLLPSSSKGHRIFVDGHVAGSGPDPLVVKCGRHSIKIGSAGKARANDLPCGGEITLPPN